MNNLNDKREIISGDANEFYRSVSLYLRLNKYDKAIKLLGKARPSNAYVHYALGFSFLRTGKLCEAEKHLSEAIKQQPDIVEAYFYLGETFLRQINLTKALKNYNLAIKLEPDFARAHYKRACLWLLRGHLKRGFKGLKWRFPAGNVPRRDFIEPKWNGRRLEGKTILVYPEEGYGDTLQFVRYLPMVQARGGRVIFECQQNLIRLIKNCSGIDEIVLRKSVDDSEVRFDYQIDLLGLPNIFKTTMSTIPASVPYMQVDKKLINKWRTKVGQVKKFKVGIVWAVEPSRENDSFRSCALSDFGVLSKIPGIAFYSLQKGRAAKQISNTPLKMDLINLSINFRDFADTAAAIENLDLVISVDTSVVHLAGALGKPAWTLLPYRCDPRWMLERTDSPWYPTMKLFRQNDHREWGDVFERVCAELKMII